jgi:APA family basic amino acid/polyamine antiporter
VPGYPVTPILFVLASLGIAVNFIVSNPAEAVRGLIVVAAGVPAFLIWQARRKRS